MSVFINGELHAVHACPTCKVQHSVPPHLERAAKEQRGMVSVFCPNGHSWVFRTQAQVREEDLIRQERDRLKQQLAQKDDSIKWQRDQREKAERQVVAYKGVITRTKKRISGGACPCCNRTFTNLHRHMAMKHPKYAVTDEVASVTIN